MALRCACQRVLAATNLFRSRFAATSVSSVRENGSNVYQEEPDGLDDGPEIPEYEQLNINFHGYDFSVLETYSKYVHNLVKNMGLDTEMFPVPPRRSRLRTFKPRSEIVDSTYDLALYHRVVQVMNLPSTRAQTLFEVIRTNLPEGVELSIREFDEDEDEFRFLPDHEVADLRGQLAEMDRIREERRKK